MVGFYLANRLEKMGLDVKLIESVRERCARSQTSSPIL